jgi:hypothetical protein
MTLPMFAVLVLIVGLILHAATWPGPTGTPSDPHRWRGHSTLNEWGRSMIWIGTLFIVWALAAHGNVTFR